MEEAAAWWNKPVGPATVLAAAAALLEAVATAGSEDKVDITESSSDQGNGYSQELILDSWQVASSGFFLPKIVPEERVFCEKQSRFIVKYGEIVNTAKYCQNS